MKNNIKKSILTIIMCLLPIILGIVLYNNLPDSMAIHFNFENVPDNYASKNFVLFGLPVIMALAQCFCMVTTNIATKSDDKKPKFINILEWFIPILTIVIYLLTISYSLGIKTYIGKTVCLVLGILFIIIGNYLPKVNFDTSKNMFHPRINDEKTFRKAIKIMAYSFIIIGIILLFLIFFV